MNTYDELVKFKPKQIKHNNIYYYVAFFRNKKNGLYLIQLYKQRGYLLRPRMIYYNPSVQTAEETDIKQHYELVFTAELDMIINKLEKFNCTASHSPTYIQDIIETFFKMYLDENEEKIKLNQEKILQLKNYEGTVILNYEKFL